MEIVCTICKAVNPTKAKFCFECGTSLAGPVRSPAIPEPAASERRQLTVVFCDMVGSTALSERLDPEDFQELIQTYQCICERIICELEGHIAQFLGDGILAYFGYPLAHEDDARRAVEAAWRIHTELEAETAQAQGELLRVRIGIHTGEVVVGTVGGGAHAEQLALGETPNLAARIQTEAKPNEVLISEATWRLARPHFQFEKLPPRMLKGISRETVLYKLVGPAGQSNQFAAENTARTRFTGRQRELETLKSVWVAGRDGMGHAVRICGEAGLGKSRLVLELSDHVLSQGGAVLVCRCSPYHRNSGLYPFAEWLARDLGFQRREPNQQKREKLNRRLLEAGVIDKDASALLAALLSISEPQAPALVLSPQRKQSLTLETISTLLRATAAKRPLLFVAEDLHWADPSSIELLGEFVHGSRDSAIMVLLTHRPDFNVPWKGGVDDTEMTLRPLDSGETEAMLRSVARDKQLPRAVLTQILERTEGIPLFVEEVTKAVLESGFLRETEECFEATGDLPQGLIPASVRDSLTARLDRLGSARETLRIASVLGRDFSFRMLLTVSAVPERVLVQALEKAEDAGLIYRASADSTSHYIFKHALIQDAAYNSLIRRTRQSYHEHVARTLTEHFKEIAAEQPELLATHFDAANCYREAVQYWLTAGTRAADRGAIHEAISHFEAALKAIERIPGSAERDGLELGVQIKLMSAHMAAHGWAANEVEACTTRARDLCVQLDDNEHLLGALWGVWSVPFMRGEMDAALRAAEPTHEVGMAIGTATAEALGRQAMGYTHCFRGEFKKARDHAERALSVAGPETARETIQSLQLATTTNHMMYLSAALWMLGETGESARMLANAYREGRELRHSPSLAQVMGYSMYLLHMWQDGEMIRRIALGTLEMADREGYAMWAPMAHLFLGWVEGMTGDVLAGIEQQRRWRERLYTTRFGLLYVQDMVMAAETLVRAGRQGEAIAALDSGIERARLHA
ncbi:MAG: putative adenylate cyclase, family 3, partial [Bryobacterales bacterium]|nr:putative adenylate cyclase, family 3 [Bryobacterales bacterium]